MEPLKTIDRGTRRTGCYLPLIPHGGHLPSEAPLSVILLPMIDSCRPLSRALTARAMLRLDTGDINRAWEDVLACYRLSRLIGDGPFLIPAMVAWRLNRYACEAATALAHHGDLTGEQAARFRRDLEALPTLPDTASKVDVGERFIFLDTVIRVIMQGRLHPDEEGLLDAFRNAQITRQVTTSFDWNDILRKGNDYFDRLVAALKKREYVQRQKSVQTVYDRAEKFRSRYPAVPSGKFKTLEGTHAEALFLLLKIAESEPDRRTRTKAAAHVLAAVLMPAVSRANEAETRAKVRMQQTRLALALAGYRADHGGYPERLAALVPEYLSQLPQDAFTGQDFHYDRERDGYRLKSYGPNGQDDNGKKDDVTIQMPVATP